MKKSLIVATLGLLAGACSVTLDVYSIVGDSEAYNGTTTGVAESGSMSISNAKGVQCIGNRIGSASGGQGLLNCSDGVRAQIQYTTLSMMSGYGFGTTTDGRSIRFTYGLSREEGAKYLGTSPVETATTTGTQTKIRGNGTGFFVTRQGHMITNAHVVNDCKEVTVARAGGSAAATIVAKDRQNDLALLRVDTPVATVAALRSARQIRQGETVVAYGFPLSGLVSSGGTLTSGTVSALTGTRDDTRFLQVSTQIQPGNSGGPLMDTTGAIVGVTTSSLDDAKLVRATGAVPQNVNFAIKTDVVRTFLDSAGVSAELSNGGRELSLPDIGEKARSFTALIECRN